MIEHSRAGAEHPLALLDHGGKTEEHRVCSTVLSFVGAGKRGREVRNHFSGPPFGWPRDARRRRPHLPLRRRAPAGHLERRNAATAPARSGEGAERRFPGRERDRRYPATPEAAQALSDRGGRLQAERGVGGRGPAAEPPSRSGAECRRRAAAPRTPRHPPPVGARSDGRQRAAPGRSRPARRACRQLRRMDRSGQARRRAQARVRAPAAPRPTCRGPGGAGRSGAADRGDRRGSPSSRPVGPGARPLLEADGRAARRAGAGARALPRGLRKGAAAPGGRRELAVHSRGGPERNTGPLAPREGVQGGDRHGAGGAGVPSTASPSTTGGRAPRPSLRCLPRPGRRRIDSSSRRSVT